MDKEILIAPCNFKLPNASVTFSSINDFLSLDDNVPHKADPDDKLIEINKDDVLIVLVEKKYPYDEKTLNDPVLIDEANEFLEKNELESFDPEIEKHMIVLRELGKDTERVQFKIKRAMSYYYTRSERPKTVLPFSIPKVEISMELVKKGYISGVILFDSSAKSRVWISIKALK